MVDNIVLSGIHSLVHPKLYLSLASSGIILLACVLHVGGGWMGDMVVMPLCGDWLAV